MTPNRYICTALDELRKAHETHNYSYMLGLIEEIQSMANRMESALADKADMDYYRKQAKELKKEVKELEEKKEALGGKKKSRFKSFRVDDPEELI